MKKLLFILIPLFITVSCDSRVDYLITTEYLYKNSTASKVNMALYDENSILIKTIAINSQQTEMESFTSDGPENGIIRPFFNNSAVVAKVILKFESTNKCITYINNQGLLDYKNYDNYDDSMVDKNENTLYFDIGSEEENSSVNCN